MKLTNERIVPELMEPLNGLLLEHLARYYFAGPIAHGNVLDLACGSGYGAWMLARFAKQKVARITGVDNDQRTIRYAAKRYAHPSCEWVCADAVDPSLGTILGCGEYDTIISFETIEHLHNDQQFLANLKTLLAPGGSLILSSPFGKGRDFPSNQEFHVFQYTPAEFCNLFAPPDWEDTRFYLQRGVLFEPWSLGEPSSCPAATLAPPTGGSVGIVVTHKPTVDSIKLPM